MKSVRHSSTYLVTTQNSTLPKLIPVSFVKTKINPNTYCSDCKDPTSVEFWNVLGLSESVIYDTVTLFTQ